MTKSRPTHDLELYRHLLLEATLGPVSPKVMATVGRATQPIFDELLERADVRLRSTPEDGPGTLDEIDWAAVRVLAPAMLELHTPGDFALLTDFTFGDLEALLVSAIAMIRRLGPGIRYQIGTCTVDIPNQKIARRTRLAVVPDAASWDRVMPECARGRREEFLGPLREHYERRTDETRLWEERAAASMAEIEDYLRDRGAAWASRRLPPRP